MIQPAQQQQIHGFSQAQVAAENAAFMRKVFLIMAAGLGTTALSALIVAHSPRAIQFIFGNPLVLIGLFVVELIMVVSFAAVARRVSAIGAGALFYAYSIVNGLTLSWVFLVYTSQSISNTFFITAAMFGGMSIYGYLTKRDLTSVGSFAMMGLWGLIIASIVNLFLRSPMLYWLTTFVGVVVFVGLTAFDVQKIKQLNVIGNQGSEEDHKEAIHGALILYLDFINLFLYLLRLFGRRR
jgi:uncharacterized protein